MTEEWTPEERKALDELPRERMPAGLEGRVVDAMRERGLLAKRRHVIELTRGRAAAVLAAGVAFIMGAYSIGLHRGGVPELPARRPQPTQVEAPAAPFSAEERAAPTADELKAREPNVPSAPPASEQPEARSESAPEPHEAGAARENESGAGLRVDATQPAEKKREADSFAPKDQAAPSAALAPSPQRAKATVLSQPKTHVTILVDGTPWTIEADSVRVDEDDRGRILIIYTREGITRIRVDAE